MEKIFRDIKGAIMSGIFTSLPDDWRKLFDERQLKEIEFARLYVKDYNHGTVGHNQLLTIEKLAYWLEKYSDRILADNKKT